MVPRFRCIGVAVTFSLLCLPASLVGLGADENAIGLHNNVCIVVPEWNLVVTRTNGGGKDGAANRPPNVDEIWSGFFARLAEAVAPQPAPIRLHPDNPQ